MSTDLATAEPGRSLLLELAERAARQPALDATNGYVLTSAQWALAYDVGAGDAEAAVVPFHTTTTVTADGAAASVQRRGVPLTADGRGIARYVEALDGPSVQTDRLPAGTIDVALVSALPRDAEALRTALLRQRGCTDQAPHANAQIGTFGAACLIGAMSDLSGFQVVPPDLRAALWQVLAVDPSVKLAGTGSDRAGRPCVAVVVEASAEGQTQRWTVMADPQTGALSGVDHALTSGSVSGVTAPAVVDFTVQLGARAL